MAAPMFVSEAAGPTTRSDPRALLPAMLQRVQPEVNEVRRILMIEDAEDTAFIVEFVEHRSDAKCTRPSAASQEVTFTASGS